MKHTISLHSLLVHLYYIGIAVALFQLTSCGRDSEVSRLRIDLENLSPADSVLTLRIEGHSFFDTEEIRVTPPKGRIRHQVKGDNDRVLLYYNGGNSFLILYPEKGRDLKVTLDIRRPLFPEIKGSDTHATLNEFAREAEEELRQYQSLLPSADYAAKAAALRTLRLKALDYYFAHPTAVGIHRIPEVYELYDARFLNDCGVAPDKLPQPLALFLRGDGSTSVGSSAPDFQVRDIQGKPFTLSWHNKKDILLHFTDNPDARTSALLKTWKEKHPNAATEILTLSLLPSDSTTKKYVSTLALPGLFVTDSMGQVSTLMEQYHIHALPHTIHIDTLGLVRERLTGYDLL